MKTLTQKSLYEDNTYQLILARIERLAPQTAPQWGSMSAAQMLAHCAEVMEVANGEPLEGTPLLVKLFKGMIRSMVVSDKPFPKNTKTHPQYRQTAERDFGAEKQRVLAALTRFKQEEGLEREHPLFGAMSVEEKGWSMYKHLDHHLNQFGV